MKATLVPLAAVLAAAAGLVVAGVAQWSGPASLVVAGVLLAVWALLFLLRTGDEDDDGRAGS